MYDGDLTMSEVLHDPLIRLMLRADRVPLGEFAKLLETAASAMNQGCCVSSLLSDAAVAQFARRGRTVTVPARDYTDVLSPP